MNAENANTSENLKIEDAQLNYHYELNGKRFGPISTKDLENLINNETLNSENLIWKQGFQDWKKVKDTDFNKHLLKDIPPPISGDKVNNTFIWILAFAPIIGSIIEQEFFAGNKDNYLLWFGLNSGLAILDNYKLKSAGYQTNNLFWAILLVPVYLWKRANLTGQSKSYFWVWILTLFLSIGISVNNPALQNVEAISSEEVNNPVTNEVIENNNSLESQISPEILEKIKAKAKLDYPNDYIVQKAIYEQEIASYIYMQTVSDLEVKRKVQLDYPNEYTVQQAVYEQEVVAKEQMK